MPHLVPCPAPTSSSQGREPPARRVDRRASATNQPATRYVCTRLIHLKIQTENLSEASNDVALASNYLVAAIPLKYARSANSPLFLFIKLNCVMADGHDNAAEDKRSDQPLPFPPRLLALSPFPRALRANPVRCQVRRTFQASPGCYKLSRRDMAPHLHCE